MLAMLVTTCGKSASATKLGSNPAIVAASCRPVPFSDVFAASQVDSSDTLAGVPALIRICERSESG